MALTPEQIDRLVQQADGLAPKEGSIFRALVKLTEAEVGKQDDSLIRQLVEALERARTLLLGDRQRLTHDDVSAMFDAANAARARLEGKS